MPFSEVPWERNKLKLRMREAGDLATAGKFEPKDKCNLPDLSQTIFIKLFLPDEEKNPDGQDWIMSIAFLPKVIVLNCLGAEVINLRSRRTGTM